MSKTIAAAGINGAHTIVARAREKFNGAREKLGGAHEVGFPNTGYYLPCIYGMLGHAVKTLDDMEYVLDQCDALLPARVHATHHLPFLGPALDAGMAALFAEEIIEAIRYLEEPDFYVTSEDPDLEHHRLWLGAADDIILRKRGVEFVDGTAPGFAAILGAAPNPAMAASIARELQEKNLYVFMGGEHNGVRFSEQLVEAGVQIGWGTRLVSFGPDVSAACFALGFATRAAMSFGGIEPGDFRKILIYNKDRVFAFAITLGTVTEEWYANGLACVNYGFPIIADTAIPQILPTGVCTYEHVVSSVPHEEIVARATEIRGLKVTVAKVPVPVSYGPAFEGERIRGEEIHFEGGGTRTAGVELTRMAPMDAVEDGKVTVIGPELDQVPPGSRLPIGIKAEVAGRQMQEDFEPILERQIHHLLNYAQGVMHIGQRDIMWVRVGKAAVAKGLKFADFGRILHAKYHQDFGNILDKVQVTIYTQEDKVQALLAEARKVYSFRDARVEGMTDEDTPAFYSCTLCQSFAPNHVCVVTPERTGLCGAYSWLDCKASFEINPTGPNQPIVKGAALDPVKGQWEGVNEFVYKASRGNVPAYNAYSIMADPMTSCGCFEAIAALLPMCNGFMTVDRDYAGMTPSGMKFTTLAGSVGGGSITPGFVGHSKLYVTSRKFVSADGGLKRLVWMPRRLKDELREKLLRRGQEIGIPDFIDRIADETVGTTEDEILPFLEEKQHPALSMDPLF
jgi:acetyl-CoA synthase